MGAQVTDEGEYRDGFLVVGDGLKLHYRDYPGRAGKPPLLCLHGLTRNARDFADFAERYSPDWRVLALDFRGRGLSDYDALPARYTPLTYAADVLQLLDHLMIGQAVFVGTSLGGLVTMTVAAMAPQRIAAAILNDVGPQLNLVGLDRIQSYIGKGERFGSWEEAAAAIEANQAGAFPNYGREEWLAMARRNCREKDGQIMFDYDAGIAEPFRTAGPVPKVDLWPIFAKLGEKPLLVIRGANSDLLTAATAAKMQEIVPRMRLATVAGVGHAPDLNEPEALAAIDEFLASLHQ
jgi:pimeloyl-ACP methyl ester carboxylesterase